MKKYIISIILSLLFFGCPLGSNKSFRTPGTLPESRHDNTPVPRVSTQTGAKLYNFTITTKYGHDLKTEDVGTAIDMKLIIKETNGFIEVSNPNTSLFKVSSSKKEEFKNAMLGNASSLKCTDISSEEEKEKDIPIEKSGNYVLLKCNLENETSTYAMPLSELKKHLEN